MPAFCIPSSVPIPLRWVLIVPCILQALGVVTLAGYLSLLSEIGFVVEEANSGEDAVVL